MLTSSEACAFIMYDHILVLKMLLLRYICEKYRVTWLLITPVTYYVSVLNMLNMACWLCICLSIVWCIGMPHKVRFQHRKKKEHERRLMRQSKECDQSHTSCDDQSLAAPMPDTPLQRIRSFLVLPSRAWSDQSPDDINTKELVVCKIQVLPGSSSSQSASMTHCLTVNSDLSWTLFVHNHKVCPITCNALKGFLMLLDEDSFPKLLSTIDGLHVCARQPDEHFMHMVQNKKGKILSSKGDIVGIVDNTTVELNGKFYSQTFCTSECEILCNSVKCSFCKAIEQHYARCTQTD